MGARNALFKKTFLVYLLHLKLLTCWASAADAMHLCQKVVFGVLFLKQIERVDEFSADW